MNYQDKGFYDERAEAGVRADIGLWACYAESGAAYDPTGDYLCGTCNMRSETNQCLRVEGPINFETGSCRIWQGGPALSEDPMPTKLSKVETGYTERPHVKGFGCRRCEFGAPALALDSQGRESWCARWGLHVLPNACCDQNQGSDDIQVRTIFPTLLESILRSRIGANLDRNKSLTPARRAAILEAEVAHALACTESGKPLHEVVIDIARPEETFDMETFDMETGELYAPTPRRTKAKEF